MAAADQQLDFSEVAIEKAREIARHRGVAIDTIVADLTELDLESGAYDLVLVAYLQLADDELTPILRRAGAAVAPGGTFLLVNHDLDNLERGHGGPQHSSVLTTAAQVVAAIGPSLEVLRSEVVERPVETDDGRRVALDTLVVARRPA